MKSLLNWLGTVALAIALLTGPATAAGLFVFPPAGGSQYPTTLPLTGNETIPADTNLTQGQNPATESITPAQLGVYTSADAKYTAATNTAAFTMTTAQMSGSSFVVLDLTGTLGASGALTTPTAAALIAANPGFPIGGSYTLRVISETASNTWTLTGGTGVTVNGTATITAGAFTDFEVQFTTATTVTIQRVGSGTK